MNSLAFAVSSIAKRLEMQKYEVCKKIINEFGYPNSIVIYDIQNPFKTGSCNLVFKDTSNGLIVAIMQVDVLTKDGVADIWYNDDVFGGELKNDN